jgi:hypothetical protein
MLKIVLAILAGVPAALLALAATRPDTFRIERSTRIRAAPATIFGLIADFRRWGSWSPYEHKDPAMRRSFTGPAQGTGAVYEWDGNKEVGEGRIEITDAAAPSRITMALDFVRPFRAHNVVEFTLTPRGDATEVTWAMHGPASYVSKVMGLFISMERMIGKDFETGLANLKAIAET